MRTRFRKTAGVAVASAGLCLMLALPAADAQEAPAPLGWSGSAAADPAPGTRSEAGAPSTTPNSAATANGVAAQTGPTADAVEKPKIEKTHFAVTKGIQIDEHQRIEAKLADLLGDPRLKDHPVGQVVVRGQAMPDENTPDGQRVNVQWDSVAFQESGRSADFANPFVSRLLAEGMAEGRITEGTRLPAYGNTDDAVYTIRSLFLSAEEAEAELARRPERTAQRLPQARASSSNDVAQGYEALEPNEADEDIPVITYEDCRPRVDVAGGQVVPQSKTITKSQDGTETSACQDSGFPVPFAYTAEGCGDVVDLEAGFAYQQQRAFWRSQNGREFVTGCETNEEFAHALVADLGKCSPVVNLSEMEAVETYELSYLDRSNNRIVVEGCGERQDSERYAITPVTDNCTPDINLDTAIATERSALVYTSRFGTQVVADACDVREGSQTFDILDTMDGCLFRPDFDAQLAVQQKRKVYQDAGGQLVSLSVCTDSEQTYPMAQTRDGCSIRLDYDGLEAAELMKWVADLPTGREDVSACAPTGNTSEIVETIDGCEAVHFDYFDAGYSRGASRLYHTLDGGRTYLTSCEENTTTYDHSFVQAGWLHNDEALESIDQLEVYIDIPAGRTLISPAAVRANSVIAPYLPRGVDTVATGQSRYSGCSAYRQTTEGDKYERADGSEVVLNGRPGPEQGPVNVCQEGLHATTEVLQGVSASCSEQAYGTACVVQHRFGNVSKFRTYNYENNATISYRCAWSGEVGARASNISGALVEWTAEQVYIGQVRNYGATHCWTTFPGICVWAAPSPCPF